MTDTQLIEQIKIRLSLTGNYHDSLIGAYAEDVKDFLRDAGVNPDGPGAIGLISRGVADLWNFGAGDGKFSDVFFQRLTQLRYEVVNEQL